MSQPTLSELRLIAEQRLQAVPPGDPLDARARTLIILGLAASVTALDDATIREQIDVAFAQGLTADQIAEVVSLVSGLGVHSLMATSSAIAAAASAHGQPLPHELNDEQRAMWKRFVGNEPYWRKFREEVPGFLESLIRLSTKQFEAFFVYCSLPWNQGFVNRQTKELISLGCDATPTHRFGPGFRLHLENAIAIGLGHRAIMETLELAARVPPHAGLG